MRGQDKHARRERALEVIKLVGLEGREDYFPRELSGGQQQRVGIARSLAIEPDIWFWMNRSPRSTHLSAAKCRMNSCACSSC